MLYQAYQLQSDLVSPLRLAAQHLSASLWIHKTERTVVRKVAAACDVLSRLRLTHSRPPYNIHSVTVGETEIPVVEETVLTLPFGTLLRFRKDDPSLPDQPKVLLAAPLSGHFATLLRETARTLLQDHDVYITDWHNARDVSLLHGGFSLDDYISYLMRFTEAVGEGSHMIAVCQPCVAALAATAVMAEDDNPAQPRSLTLMAGPVDCRVNPTEVNKLATSQPIAWFEKNLISHVPLPHAGFMRRVYPGFVQLSAFISMNPERHKQSFRNIYDHLQEGRVEEAQVIQDFYEEYLAVNDLPRGVLTY
ncbi:MAG: polyhydroxyalkanoate depolymerase, partial [Gammaproteobacteria bacterium]|nr:polyhydroxyalkanoate depolymerase [Gammaproteobacteria bacterium]